MAFQAAVATWFAVHILVRLPVGGRFGLNGAALPTAVRLETGTGLDDIEVTQSDGGRCSSRARHPPTSRRERRHHSPRRAGIADAWPV